MSSRERSFIRDPRRAPVQWWVAGLYVLALVAIYWPVFSGHRFFWEDFFNQEYPIRDYFYYMVRWKHALPFWNPYSLAWGPILADAQSGFWYPTNLLQIGLTWLIAPSSVHLPVIVPEAMTLLHFPLAAFGMFVLLRRKFSIGTGVAILGGFCWGFGLRMAAEQNHQMVVLQLALLPWEVLLLLSSYKKWRRAIWLGLVLGASFLAGSPQVFLYVAVFLGALALAESVRRLRRGVGVVGVFRPVVLLAVAMVLAMGVASVQLLPTLELVRGSGRVHLDYASASIGSLPLQEWLSFVSPRVMGEYPSFAAAAAPTMRVSYWYWESIWYWSLCGELLALFAIVRWLRDRRELDADERRYLGFFLLYGVLAILYALGDAVGLQWLFWRYVPFFDQIRAPNRLIWFAWFIGVILTARGLQWLILRPDLAVRHRWVLRLGAIVMVALNALAISGVLDHLFHLVSPKFTPRTGLGIYLLPSMVLSVALLLYVWYVTRRARSSGVLWIGCAVLIVVDLVYFDASWFRNTVSSEASLQHDAAMASVVAFRAAHGADHSRLLFLGDMDAMKPHAGLGTYLRVPIEFGLGQRDLESQNPLSSTRLFLSGMDTLEHARLLGVSRIATLSDTGHSVRGTLPALKLYAAWRVARDSSARRLLLSGMDIRDTVVVDSVPMFHAGRAEAMHDRIAPVGAFSDSVAFTSFSENGWDAVVRATGPRVLAVNALSYPAWSATVDGRPVRVLRTFGMEQGVAIDAGVHHVRMAYRSATFSNGWKISVASLLLAFGILFWRGKREKNRVVAL